MNPTKIYDDTDPAFVYASFWFAGTWNASTVGQIGTLHSTNDPAANVTFTFPVAAMSFTIFGIKRSHGGSYGICVDCDPNEALFLPVDGFNATDNGTNPPVALYSQTFSKPGVHIIILQNQPDSRGTPPGNSQLALDRIELQLSRPESTYSTSPSTPIHRPGVSLVTPAITIENIAPTSASHITSNTSIHQHITIETKGAPLSTVSLPVNITSIISTSLSTSSLPVISSNFQSPMSPGKPTGMHVLGGLALIAVIFLMIRIIRLRTMLKYAPNAENEGVESFESTLLGTGQSPCTERQTPVRGDSGGNGTTTSSNRINTSAAQLYDWGTAAAHIRHKYAHTGLQENQGGLNSSSQLRQEHDARIVIVLGDRDMRGSETLPPSYGEVFTGEPERNQVRQLKCLNY